MTESPEQKARKEIDGMLDRAGWKVQHLKDANIHAGRGVAIREFPLNSGHGFADYLLYVEAQAAGVIEAKKVGSTPFQALRYNPTNTAKAFPNPFLPGIAHFHSVMNQQELKPNLPTDSTQGLGTGLGTLFTSLTNLLVSRKSAGKKR